jgi:hypothetical protein
MNSSDAMVIPDAECRSRGWEAAGVVLGGISSSMAITVTRNANRQWRECRERDTLAVKWRTLTDWQRQVDMEGWICEHPQV